MATRLESLRVTADFASSDYVRGMAQLVSAAKSGAAANREVGASVSEATAKVADGGGAIGRLSRMYIDGYGRAQRFNKEIASLGREIDKDASVMLRAEAILEGMYRKFGLAADASALLERGQVGLAVAVQNVNQKIAAQNETLERNAREAAAASQAQKSQSYINQWAGITLPGGDNSARAADIEAAGKAADATRAKMDPLYRIQQAYRKELEDSKAALRNGSVDQKVYAEHVQRTKDAFAAQVVALKAAGGQAGLTSFAYANLGYQINDIATGLATGQSPFMILAQQGGQVYQILGQHPQGVGGAVKELGSKLLGLATPTRIAATGIFAVAAAGVLAQNSYRKAQIEIELALMGIGRASGVTVGDVNRAADATARLSKNSTSEMRATLTAIAASGQVAAEHLAETGNIAQDLAKILGVDVVEAGKLLGKVFIDPARGARELNESLGAMDAATLRVVQNLTAQGKLQEANLIIVRAVDASIKGASDKTTGWTAIWNRLSNSISEGSKSFGKSIDEALGGGDQEERLARLKTELEGLQWLKQQPWRLDLFGSADGRIEKVRAEISLIEKSLERSAKQAEATARNLESIKLDHAVRSVLPERDEYDALKNRREILAGAIGDPQKAAALGLSVDQVTDAFLRADRALASYADTNKRAAEASNIALRAVAARSPAEIAEVARLQTYAQLRGQGIKNAEAEQRANDAAMVAFAQANQQLKDAARDRMLAVKDAIGQSEIEIQAIGKTLDQVELLRLNWQAEADLRREAARNHTDIDKAELDRLKAQNEQLAKRKQLLAEAQLSSDLRFEREQMFRDPTEQAVYTRLRPIYGDDLSSAQAQYLAQQIRVNEVLRETNEAGRGAFKGLISDLRAGKTAGEAALNVFNRIADKLIDIGADASWSAITGRGGSSGLLSLLGIGGSSSFGKSSGSVADAGVIDVWAGLRHTGLDAGPASATGPGRYIHPSYFENAPRRHNGLKPGERAQVVLDGEETGWPWQFAQKYGRMSSGSQRSVVELIVRAEEGELFRPTIAAASRDTAITVVQANERGRQKKHEAGADFA